jgi:hypothetical protein
MRTKPEIESASDEALVMDAWRLMTNNRQCGGVSAGARPVAQRRLRKLGVRYYLAIETDDNGRSVASWGIGSPPEGADVAVTGVTLSHAAHKLGGGNATKGWSIYWGAR